jgi:hypothetical protein
MRIIFPIIAQGSSIAAECGVTSAPPAGRAITSPNPRRSENYKDFSTTRSKDISTTDSK